MGVLVYSGVATSTALGIVDLNKWVILLTPPLPSLSLSINSPRIPTIQFKCTHPLNRNSNIGLKHQLEDR